jgi:hypothetical protein
MSRGLQAEAAGRIRFRESPTRREPIWDEFFSLNCQELTPGFAWSTKR